MRTLSDADDIRLTLQGDETAFGRLYDRHANSVRAVVAAVSRDFEAVDDLTQETFLRAFRRLATLKDPSSFHRWVHGIARRVAKEQLRGLCRRQRTMTESSVSVPVVAETEEIAPLDKLQREEEVAHLLSVIADLPERERWAVHAYYFHEQNAEQAAADLGVSRSGFYLLLQRSLTRIRKYWAPSFQQPSGDNDEAN